MVTIQRLLELLRLRRSWIAVATLALLALLAWVFVPHHPAAAQDDIVVKTYTCQPGQSTTIAERLREELGTVDGVRIAADARGSQVVVQAPQSIQVLVAKRLGDVTDAKPVVAARDDAGKPTQTRTMVLQRLTTDQLESALGNVLGDRFATSSTPRDGMRAYRLTLASGNLDMALDTTRAQVKLTGMPAVVDSALRLIQVLDAPPENGRNVRLLPLHTSRLDEIQRAAATIRTVSDARPVSPSALAYQAPAIPGGAPAGGAPAAAPGAGTSEGRAGLVNPVRIELLEGLDVLILSGSPQDVQQVADIIKQIEAISIVTKPEIRIIPVQNVDCEALNTIITNVYNDVYLARQGRVSITPVITPNSLFVIGRKENVDIVATLAEKLDQPMRPDAQFRVFQLKYASATVAQAAVQNFFNRQGGLSPIVSTTVDDRTNALIVQASPRDMGQVADLISHLDTRERGLVNEVRIIRLEHATASDVAAIMQSAISAAVGGTQLQQQGVANQLQTTGGTQAAMIRFLTYDANGRRLLNTGILSNVKITTDARANALVVSAPSEDMELIETLIHQIDRIPAAEAQIKVFTIQNGDATNLQTMLQQLFGLATTTTGGVGNALQSAIQTVTAGGDNTVVTLHFSVDQRTNSIVASGTSGDLSVVEAILTKLDASDVLKRRTTVIRLKNSPASDLSTTINNYITSQLTYDRNYSGLTSPHEEFEREVIVVPEPVTNSLVLSATERYFDEFKNIIQQLDARPLMVAIQVLIASVELGDTNEFGIELGLQDTALFDRSTLSNLQTTSTTLPNGTTTQAVVSADAVPGLNFNNVANPLGSSGMGTNLSPQNVAGQGLSNFSVGRENSSLGYGGLVLSAQSENVSALLRALAENHRVQVLERPQIAMLDNQQGSIQVGQRVPTISSVSNNALSGQSNSVTFQNVGVMLGVQPRISPDGMVVMYIDVEKSALESEATGIPIFSSPTGQVVRSPIIDSTVATTTVSAMDGQTIVLSGLISQSKNESHRKVPWLGDIPLVGNLFRFDSVSNDRTELLIIMTPHIIHNPADADAIRRDEAARMNWCLCDVTKLYGDVGLRARTDTWGGSEVKVIYPDSTEPQVLPGTPPTPEPVPAPQPRPGQVLPTPSSAPSAAPQPGNTPPMPSQSGSAAPSPGDPVSGMQLGGAPVASQRPVDYPPAGTQGTIQTAAYQQQPGGYLPPNAASPQPAVYQQPMGPAPYQAPMQR